MITGFHVSTEKGKLNLPWICAQLRGSYWGAWLTDEQIKAAMVNSINFGVYGDDVLDGGEIVTCGQQIGFGRVVTDGHTFSSIMDIVIAEEHRNRGLGSMLMRAIIDHPDVKKTVCIISTMDRGFWYSGFGFEPCPIVMKRDPHE